MLINMNVGGTEKALLNMIAAIPKDQYEITIFMLEESGGFLNYIPADVHVKYLTGYENMRDMLSKPPQVLALEYARKGKMIKALHTLSVHIISKVTNNRSLFFSYVSKDSPMTDDEYDVAVAYAGPMEFISFYVANKLKARKKVQWIHFDISKIGFNSKFASKMYKRLDRIFVVSEEGKNKFIQTMPGFESKTDSFFNIINPDLIIQMANKGAGFEDHFEGMRILTVGRLSHEKGQDLTIPVLAKLKQEGYKVKWYCIGEGVARDAYEKLIASNGLENDYILLGTHANPYPFMKQCDIYVQPSRHEGYCITLSEARCFNNPIVSTNFTGAEEQISHGETGLIVDIDTQQIYHAIKKILDDKHLRNRMRACLENDIVKDTTQELSKLYKVAEGI